MGFGFWKAQPENETKRKAIEVVVSINVQRKALHVACCESVLLIIGVFYAHSSLRENNR